MPVSLFAQKENANWYYGHYHGLHFSDTGVAIITDSAMPSIEGAASISDSAGNLLFYTNGQKVWNRNNEIMPNGDTLFNSPIFNPNFPNDWTITYGSTATNGVLIIPIPLSNNRYYIFSKTDYCFCTTISNEGIVYSVINMNLDSGMGDIEYGYKNLILDSLSQLTEKLAAVKHGNGRDYWLIGHQLNNNVFVKYLITPYGIEGPFLQGIGSVHDIQAGEINISRQGDKLAVAAYGGVIDCFDFDRCSGAIDNVKNYGYNANDPNLTAYYTYGVCFSPDAKRLYYNNFDSVIQIDLETDNKVLIKLTDTPYTPQIFSDTSFYYAQMELAPNDRIYITYTPGYYLYGDSAAYWLSEVTNPNEIGVQCNFIQNGIKQLPNLGWFSLPNTVNYSLGPLEESGCDTLTTSKEIINQKIIVNVYPNPSNDKITIEILNGIKPKSIVIQDVLGKTLIQIKPNKPTNEVNISMLSSGVYFANIEAIDGNKIVKKIVNQ